MRTNSFRLVPLLCAAFMLWSGPESARSVRAQCRSTNVNAGISDPINPNLEFNEYAAISVDARDANCKDTASAKLAAKLSATLGYVQSTSCPPHMVRDNQIGACATPFKTWLAGDMVTHIFRAALALESWQIFVSPNLLQQVENDFAGNAPGNVAMPQDPYCGSQSMPGGVNSCMDDFALTATGFGWIAAWENRKNAGGGSPGSYISAAQSAITQAFSPMTQNGGGPCYYVIGSNPIQCNGDFAGNPNCPGPNCPVRIMGANHDIENPAYGLGLMTSIASACVGLYIAGAPCDLSGQAQIGTELMKSAQDRLAQGDNSHFASTSRPDAAGQACLDFKTVTLTADCADVYDYHPTDMPMQRFYDKKGLPRPNPDLYQFDRDDPGLASHYPNNGCMDFYGCNRQEFYDELTWNLWGPDTTAPVVTWTSPQDGAVLSGIVTLAVNATDNLKVSSVEIYANGSRLTPTYTDCSQIPGATAILGPPYRLCVDTSNGSVDGTYTLTAKAYDEAGNVGNSAPITITVSNRSCQPGSAGDWATFDGQSGIPSSMLPGSTANVSITMRNTGSTCWTETGMYRLGSQNPQDNSIWGLGRVYLNPGETIAPGQTKTFSFTIRAPLASGNYNFQWRMVHEGVQWFGDYTPNVAVTVNGCVTPIAPAPTLPSTDVVWVEDQLPGGAIAVGTWTWDSTQKASGSQSNTEPAAAGVHQHFFYGASQTLSVGGSDKLVAYVLLDPCNPPQEVMLQWNDGSWEHRAFWGSDLIGWGAPGTAGHVSMGGALPTGQWIRLEVPASTVGLAGANLNGMAFTLYGGRAWFDRAGLTAPALSVTLTSPVAGIVTGNVVFQAQVTSSQPVSQVQYFAGSTYVGTAYQAPYTFSVDTSPGNVEGSYTLYAKAFDSFGGVATSAPVSITVSNPHINCGGGAYTDPGGGVWRADQGFDGGYPFATSYPISGTSSPTLYQSERWSNTTFSYRLQVSAGWHLVTLKFAEIYFGVYTSGQRVENVAINGQTVLQNFDPLAAAGGPNIAVDRQFWTYTLDGWVTITFVPVVSNPKISAIQIQ